MSESPPRQDLNSAIAKGMIVDAITLTAGGALWLATGELYWFIGAFVIGSVAFALLLAQAGAFTRQDEQR